MAGIDKHKWTWAQVYDKDHFDKHGFVPPTTKVVKTTYLYELEQGARANKLEKKGAKFYFEFKGKVLANGSITHPVSIKAYAWSRNVEEKLKAAGGDITKLEGEPKPVVTPAHVSPKAGMGK